MEAQPFELSFLSPGASVRSRGRALPSQAGPGKAPRPARPAAPFPRSLPRLRDVHGTSSVFHRDNRSYRALGASPGPALTLSAARSSPGAAGRSRGQERGRSRGRQRRRGRPSPSTARRRGRGSARRHQSVCCQSRLRRGWPWICGGICHSDVPQQLSTHPYPHPFPHALFAIPILAKSCQL